MFDITFVRYESSKRSMHILFWTAPSIWQQTAEWQSLPVTGFLRVIYAILNASVILERNETRLARNEKRLERNETRLARNETRGGNLLLSGTVFGTDRAFKWQNTLLDEKIVYQSFYDAPLTFSSFSSSKISVFWHGSASVYCLQILVEKMISPVLFDTNRSFKP